MNYHLQISDELDKKFGKIAKKNKKPLWRFIVESEPEKILSWLTFKYIEDVLNPDQVNRWVDWLE